MTYQVLARKWRPRTFQQMIGQEPILRMLTHALRNERLHHAYLFSGTRGVGKTTLARIFAKCLNCETGITDTPCGQCAHCTAIDAGRFLDLLEVDAASRTKVEDTRELLDNVHYQPTLGRYKIYLIDEVHMLSGHSFNALLKTLEEPPSYVKFLLATTEPKRLPITILSRCLQFNLKRVPIDEIAKHLQHICSAENIPFDAPALTLLSQAADGSVRDALSLLDQAIAYTGEKILLADTEAMLGSVSFETLLRLLQAIHANDGKQLLMEIENLEMHAVNFYQALDEILSILHQISLAQVIPDAPHLKDSIITLAKQFKPEDIQLYYQIALIGRRDLPYAPTPKQGFEMILLRMLSFRPVIIIKEEEKIIPPKAIEKPVTPSLNPRTWIDTLDKLALTGLAYALASNCTLLEISDTKVKLALAIQHEPMLNKKLTERIEQALVQYLNKPIKLEILVTSTVGETPVKKQKEEDKARQAKATEAIQNDDDVQKIMGIFDATLDLNSIKTI